MINGSFSFLKKFLLSLLLTSTFFSYSQEQTLQTSEDFPAPKIGAPQNSIAQQLVFPQEVITAFQDISHAQIDQLLSIFNSIGQALQNNLFKKVTNPEKVRVELMALQKSLEEFRAHSSMHVDKFQLVMLGRLVKEFTSVLIEALKNKLVAIPAVNPTNILKRDGLVSLESMQELLKSNQVMLNILEKLTINAPLAWYNHTTRAVTSFWKRYKLGPITEHIAVYTGMALFTLFIFPEERLKNDFLPDRVSNFLINLKKSKWIGGAQGEEKEQIKRRTIPVDIPCDENGTPLFNQDGKYLDVKATLPTFVNSQTGEKIPAHLIPENASIFSENYADLARATGIESNTTHALYRTENKAYITNLTDLIDPLISINYGKYAEIGIAAFFAKYVYNDFLYLKGKAGQLISDLRDTLEARKSTKKSYTAKSDTNFDSMLGRDHIKKRFAPLIDYIVHQERYTRAGIKIPCGYLLAGPPQTGKTFLIDCLTGEIARQLEEMGRTDKLRVYHVSVHDILEVDPKSGKIAGVAYWVALAREKAPCIIFIDEFDNLRAQRDSNATLLAECLQILHESILSDERSPVFVIAATNRPENIDYALRQPGRFGEIIYFPFPLKKDREIYFNHYFKKRAMDTTNLNIDMLVRSTEGCSYGVMQVAANKVLTYAKESHEPVGQKHIVQAVNDAIKQIVKYDQEISEKTKRIIATRFASKALISLLLNPDQKLCSVTIEQVIKDVGETHVSHRLWNEENGKQNPINYGGIFSYYTQDMLDMISTNEQLKQCKIALSGNIGQQVLEMDYVSHAEDLTIALELAKKIIFRGQNQTTVSRYERELKLGQSYKLVEECEKELFSLLSSHKETLITIIEALMKCSSLSTEEILEIEEIEPVQDTSKELICKALLFTPKIDLYSNDSQSINAA